MANIDKYFDGLFFSPWPANHGRWRLCRYSAILLHYSVYPGALFVTVFKKISLQPWSCDVTLCEATHYDVTRCQNFHNHRR